MKSECIEVRMGLPLELYEKLLIIWRFNQYKATFMIKQLKNKIAKLH